MIVRLRTRNTFIHEEPSAILENPDPEIGEISRLAPGLRCYLHPQTAEEAPPLDAMFQSAAGNTDLENLEKARPLDEASDEDSLQREGLGSQDSLTDVSEWVWPPEEARPLDPPPRAPDDPLYCPACEMWLNGPDQLKNHEEGKKHRRKLCQPEAWKRMLQWQLNRLLSETEWEHAEEIIEDRLGNFDRQSLKILHTTRIVLETAAAVADWEEVPPPLGDP